MSTHQKVKESLDRTIKAHQNSHRHRLRAAGLEDYTEATISPMGSFDAPLSPGGDDNA